jgi:hypothetical protein
MVIPGLVTCASAHAKRAARLCRIVIRGPARRRDALKPGCFNDMSGAARRLPICRHRAWGSRLRMAGVFDRFKTLDGLRPGFPMTGRW